MAKVGVHPTDPASLTKHAVPARCPTQCEGLLLWYRHEGRIDHYKAWIRKGQDWYECESIHFSAYQTVKKLQDADWSNFKGIVYCLVQINAYNAGTTMIPFRLDASQCCHSTTHTST